MKKKTKKTLKVHAQKQLNMSLSNKVAKAEVDLN